MPASLHLQFQTAHAKAFGVKICAGSIRKARNCRNRSTRWGRRFRLYDEASAAVSPITADAGRSVRPMSIVGKLQAMHNLGHFREVCVDHVRFDALRQELIDVSVRYMLTLTHGEQSISRFY